MDRMREHVMKEFDQNSDRMLSYEEFQLGVNGTGAKNDQGWQVRSTSILVEESFRTHLYLLQSIEDSTVYSDQDFKRFSEELEHASTVSQA